MLGRCSPCSAQMVELWRRIRLEFTVELPLLKARWKQVLFGALFQYFHAMSTQLAHRMHQPLEEPLGDIGFRFMPELGLQNAWVTETIFWCMFIPFIIWSFSPFVTARKRFYTAVLYARLLMVLVICQFLRIISFTVTQLPAPNYHCRLGKDTAVREMPEHWWGHVVVDLGRQATHGCGDLIFSSHTTFVLTGVLTFTEYGETLAIKVVAWIAVSFMGLCIVASRKHYSVDVVVAFYTVPLVFYTMHRRWTTKRLVQDDCQWPHRPLAGEEEVELTEVDLENGEDGKMDMSKQPLLPPLLPVVQQGRSSVTHSRSSSRSQVDFTKVGGSGMPNLPAAAAEEAAAQRAANSGASSSGVRHPRPRSIAVMAAPAPEAYETHREDSPRESRLVSGGSGIPAVPSKQRIT